MMGKEANLRAVANRKRRKPNKRVQITFSPPLCEVFKRQQAEREYLAESMAQDAERVAGMMRALSQSYESSQAAMVWRLVAVGALGIFAILLTLKLSS